MKLKRAILSVVALAGLSVSLLTTGTAYAAVTCPDGTIHVGQSKPTYAECNIDSSATTDDLLGTVKNVINVILGILGVVAVVVIILGGFTFITSQGDAGKVMKGRNTILWGVVGLIVALLAFTIVNFVLNGVFSSNNSAGGGNINIQPDSNGGGGGNINIQPGGNAGGGNVNIQPSGNNNAGGGNINIQPN